LYKVLIVDDETWVLENYRLGIQWEKMGFQVVATAANGMEALECIQQCHPHVIITDIRMPVMGGLELIRQVKQQSPDTEFIVISGYAEFSYAQKALNFGVAGYCLKPVEEADLQAVLVTVKDKLDRLNDKRTDFFTSLEYMADELHNDEELDAQNLGLHWDAQQGMRVLICVGRWDPSRSSLWNVVVPLGVDRRACFISEEQLEASQKELAGIPDLVVGISHKVQDVGLVNNAIVEAQIAAHQNFMTNQPGIYLYQNSSRGPLREILGQLRDSLELREAVPVTEALTASPN